MKTTLKSVISVLVALAAVVGGERVSFANEPTNNTFPGGSSIWNGTAYVFECPGSSCGWGGGYFGGYLLEISSTTDVDYFLLVCGGNTTVSSVWMNISTTADLDLAVYKPNTALIGSSTGTTNTETVNSSGAKMNAVVAKIYGYNGAKSGYQINFACSN